MYKNKSTVKVLIVMMTSLMLFATGCTLTDNNRVRQNTRDNDQGPEIFRDRNNADNRINRPFGDVDNGGLNGERNGLFNADNGGTRNGNKDGLRTAEDRVDVADRAAENITKLKGVRQANVLVTRRNAYVAAALDDDQKKLTRDIEDQIAKQVRAADSDIQNVYVSTNPQFVDRINGYVDDVQQGRPVVGFVEEFNEMVARIFPNAR
ncbi:YhcN/YlaJ family sporulation lipoprotein [Paenibacillus sp. LHD-38]|uniref:YhcN/YlaJ family sporulation lipoprotein n=1 Tax=Paenibacillus sp. LHD-38 TaxID=3072143 RepID=UPI00280CA997|nr:YhcN/YlaJ family sporulation lipoprotein [Paenibacillus sp. LHD-38]MDQ8738024.1 YhcN/YlaJ family sporulation lipoprotein [Paenibacillus sp. LHD-38]